MKRLKGQEGFTLIELVIIILILGILAATAIPRFYDLSAKAKEAAENGVAGGVRGGIATTYASNLLAGNPVPFPLTLGGTAGGTCAVPPGCFGNVLTSPLIDATWSIDGTGFIYTGPNLGAYTYNPATGTFLKP